MRIAMITLVAAFLGVVLSACECGYLDCFENNYDGHFRIVKASDGTDLVFGASKIYDKRKIRFYTLKGVDTIFFDYHPIKSSLTNMIPFSRLAFIRKLKTLLYNSVTGI